MSSSTSTTTTKLNSNGNKLDNSETENDMSVAVPVTSEENCDDSTNTKMTEELLLKTPITTIKNIKSPKKDPKSDIEDDIKEIFGGRKPNILRKDSRSRTLSNASSSKRSPNSNKSPTHSTKGLTQPIESPASIKSSPRSMKSPAYDTEVPSTSKRAYSTLIENITESEREDDFLLGFDKNGSIVSLKNQDSFIESETPLKKFKEDFDDTEKSGDESTEELEGTLQIAESGDEENLAELKTNNTSEIEATSPRKSTEATPKLLSPKIPTPALSSPKLRSPRVATNRLSSPKIESPKSESAKIQSPKSESAKIQSPKYESAKIQSPKIQSITLPSPTIQSPKNQSPKSQSTKEIPEKLQSPKIPEITGPHTPVLLSNPVTTSSTKLRPCDDPIFKKPFEFGWKREVVLRALPGSRDKGEIYYITPNGKKLRTRNEIYAHLTTGLSLDNFTFSKDALNADPEHETIRIAKPMSKHTTPVADVTPRSTSLGKRTPKPKVPKGASPPPEGWTPGKAAAGSYNVTAARSRAVVNTTEVLVTNKTSNVANKKNEICTIQCPLAMGIIPQLKCLKCLCSYHPECVGLFNTQGKLQKNYECSSCKRQIQQDYQNSHHHQQPQQLFSKNSLNDSDINNKLTKGHQQRLNKDSKLNLKKSHFSVTASNNNNNNNNSNNNNNHNNNNSNNNVTAQAHNKVLEIANSSSQQKNKISNDENIENSTALPQSVAVLNGRKYLLVRKPTDSNEKINNSSLNEGTRKRSGVVSVNNVPQKNLKAETFASNFLGNVSIGYDVLLNIFQYLKVQELLRAACVCRVWNVVANHRSLWKTVRMKNSQVNDWVGLAASLRRNETQHLDLRKMICQKDSSEEQMWSNFTEHIKSVITLKQIDLGKCPSDVIQNLFEAAPQLVILNAFTIKTESLNLENIYVMENLQELRLKTSDGCNLESELVGFECLTSLRHLSLTSINDLGKKNCDVFGNLINLESLELGECSFLTESFAENVLLKLHKLERLRLEKSSENIVTCKILQAIPGLPKLVQLELINFDIKEGFEEHIILCKNIKRLLLIPTYISQSATTNHIILSSMRKLATTLESLIWVVTMELLRVTALYVDQVGPKVKKQIDESIPVLKPVPGLQNKNSPEQDSNQSAQVDILPLTKIKEILADAMPNAKHKILKLAYPSTWRQNFIE